MKPSPGLVEPSLHSSEEHTQPTTTNSTYTPSIVTDAPEHFFENTRNESSNQTYPRNRIDVHNSQWSLANNSCHSFETELGFDIESNVTHEFPLLDQTRQSISHGHGRTRINVNKYVDGVAPASSIHDHLSQHTVKSPALDHRRSFCCESATCKPTHPALRSYSRHNSAPPQSVSFTKYDTFRGRFNTSEEAKDFRHSSMRFDRVPWKHPSDDETIGDIAANRVRHVERIYNAMTRSDIARDNPGSTAMKRWVYDAHYPSDMVEAYAHKVFDALLEQVNQGFRGWNQNDYVVDERKGEDEDRDIDCAGRLDNIVTALEQEKSICENVMSSSNQIRMFVNAPKAYSKRKDQNRVGNGKRPNAKGLVAGEASDTGALPSKKRKVGTRHSRARSSTLSDVVPARDTTPQVVIQPSRLPYYTTPALQRVAMSPPVPSFLAPRVPVMDRSVGPIHSKSFDQRHMLAMSPPTIIPRAHTPQSSGMTSIPSALQSPFKSPEKSSRARRSLPRPPSATHFAKEDTLDNPWPSVEQYKGGSSMVTPAPQSERGPYEDWTTCQYGQLESANVFEHNQDIGVSLADIESMPSTQLDYTDLDLAFPTYWSQQDGAQHFSFDDHLPHNHHRE